MTILQRNSGTFNAATTFNVARATGSFGTGTKIVVAIVGNTVVTTPGSMTQRATSVVDMGVYAYDKTAAGEANIAFTCSTGSGVWFVWELSAGCTFQSPASATQVNTGSSNYTSGTVTPASGAAHLLAAIGGTGGAGVTRSVASFSDSFTLFGALQATAQDYPFAAGADRDVTANGSTAYSTMATFSGTTNVARGAVLLAYTNASSGDVTAPTVPTGLTVGTLTSNSAGLSWTASTDAVGVTGYDIEVVGP